MLCITAVKSNFWIFQNDTAKSPPRSNMMATFWWPFRKMQWFSSAVFWYGKSCCKLQNFCHRLLKDNFHLLIVTPTASKKCHIAFVPKVKNDLVFFDVNNENAMFYSGNEISQLFITFYLSRIQLYMPFDTFRALHQPSL